MTVSLPILRAIRAAMAPEPDPLLIDAASRSGGVDTGKKMGEAHLEAMLDAGVSEAIRRVGGR